MPVTPAHNAVGNSNWDSVWTTHVSSWRWRGLILSDFHVRKNKRWYNPGFIKGLEVAMFAFKVSARNRHYGIQLELIVKAPNKKEVKEILVSNGWSLESKIREATIEEISSIAHFEHADERVQGEIAERARREEQWESAWRAQKAQEELAVQAQFEAEQQRARSEEEWVLNRIAGDLFNTAVEVPFAARPPIISVCNKSELFLSQPFAIQQSLLASITMEFSEFDAHFSLPIASELLGRLVADLTQVVALQDQVGLLGDQLRLDGSSAEGRLNSLASRSYVVGGSGDGLFLSLLFAHGAASQDEREARDIQDQYQRRVRRAHREAYRIGIQQMFHATRVQINVGVLEVACGRRRGVDTTVPEELKKYLLQQEYRT